MTEEKRKRGRPPGSGKKKGISTPKEGEYDKFNKEFDESGYSTTPRKGILAVNADKFEPMPENWFSMGKIEKLQWLTEHRK